MDPPSAMPVASFEHAVFVHEGLDDFLRPLVPFVNEGVERGEAVFVVVGSRELAALREGVDRPSGVRWLDTDEWHPVPARRIRAYHEVASAELVRHDRARIVAALPWPAGPSEFVREWARYESVVNAVFDDWRITAVCAYDAAALDPAIVADAARSHPTIGLGHPRGSCGRGTLRWTTRRATRPRWIDRSTPSGPGH